MTILEANEKIEHLENQIKYYQEKRVEIFSKTQPQATKFDSDRVSGGIRRNKLEQYAIEMEDIETNMRDCNSEIHHLMNFIDNELKTIGKYDPLAQDIIRCRNEYHLTWDKTSKRVGYCKRQCERIYDKYKGKGKNGNTN